METVDEYLKTVTPSQKIALERIRALVKKLVPDAEETISYGMPTYKYNGKVLIHFAAFKDHLSIFPTADLSIDTGLNKKLEKYRSGKGTLQFTLDDPIPDDLIKDIVKIRLNDISKN